MSPVPQRPHEPRRPASESNEDAGSADLFDWSRVADYVGFCLRSVARHAWLAALIFVAVVGFTLVLVWGLPKSYHVESRILAQRNQLIGALAVPSRLIHDTSDSPTGLAAETVLRRDNLLELIQQTDLVSRWDKERAPLAHLKDVLMAKIGRATLQKDKIDILEGTLETKLTVTMTVADAWTGDGTLTIAVDWPDPKTAYKLVIAAQQNFLEARHAQELDNISEAISLLSERANTMREEIDAAALQFEAARTEKRTPVGSEAAGSSGESATRKRSRPAAGEELPPKTAERPLPMVAAPPAEPAVSEAELAQIKANWETKQAAIRDLEDARHRRGRELEARLAEQRMTYGDSHPIIIDLMSKLDGLTRQTPEVIQLRREEAELRNEYRTLAGREPDAPAPAHAAAAAPVGSGSRDLTTRRLSASLGNVLRAVASTPADPDNPVVQFAKAELDRKTAAYYKLLDRIDNARMELETAEVAFKYRYTVISPARVPNSPKKPVVPLVIATGVVAALLLALFAAVATDVRGRRIIERWQIERSVGIPVVAELQDRV